MLGVLKFAYYGFVNLTITFTVGLFSNFYILNGLERIMPPNMV